MNSLTVANILVNVTRMHFKLTSFLLLHLLEMKELEIRILRIFGCVSVTSYHVFRQHESNEKTFCIKFMYLEKLCRSMDPNALFSCT